VYHAVQAQVVEGGSVRMRDHRAIPPEHILAFADAYGATLPIAVIAFMLSVFLPGRSATGATLLRRLRRDARGRRAHLESPLGVRTDHARPWLITTS
jgi:hypothetical protein